MKKFYKLEVKGTRCNALILKIDNLSVGTVDVDHETIKVDYSKEEFKDCFGEFDLAQEVNNFLNEEACNYDFNYDFTVYFRVYTDEEQEEYFYEE